MKYLKKFENHSAYEAAQSGLILPNVSLCVQENEVHYNPSTPPTPSLYISAMTIYDEEVETPFCDYGNNVWLHFSRPVSFNELQNLSFEACVCGEDNPVTFVDSTIEEDRIVFTSLDSDYLYIKIDKFEGTVDNVYLSHSDDSYWYNRISI